ncbi:MAG: HAD family hydrolase [Bacillota bacterium]|jgi:phosphoglycolate phosphatase
MKNHGLIFDMDNTILDTHIDFGKMHRKTAEAAAVICRQKLKLPPADFSGMATGQIIQWGADNNFSAEDIAMLWEQVADIEAEGMRNIVKEDGIDRALSLLQAEGYYMTVLTNNSLKAAGLAMENSGLAKYFREIHARDEYRELKPSPKGLLSIMENNSQIKQWLMIGDSWLDGEAAKRASIPFAAYGKRDSSYWQSYNLTPQLWLKKWDEKVLPAIKNLLV